MARAALEHALSPQAIDALFEHTAQRQSTRTLLFSRVVDLMDSVVARIQPAVNAAYRAKAEALGASLRAVYAKLERTEPGFSAELVRHTARTLGPVINAMGGERAAWLPGYRVKTLDGNHLAGTRHRLKELRAITNLPAEAADALAIADLYRRRSTVESAFGKLATCFNGEIDTLGYPKAALFAFRVALVSGIVMRVVKAALRSVHGEAAVEGVSFDYLADEVAGTHRGMMIAIGERGVNFIVHQLLLQAGEERLHRRVVPAIRPPAHAAVDPLASQDPAVVLAGVLAAAVGEGHQALSRQASRHGHLQRIDHQTAVDPLAHRPADDPPRVQVLHGRQVQPAFKGRDLCDVGRPGLVGRPRLELAIHDVLGDGLIVVGVGGAAQPPPGLRRDPLAAHQLGHGVDAAGPPPSHQFGVVAGTAAAGLDLVVDRLDLGDQGATPLLVGTCGPTSPGGKAAGYLQDPAHEPGRPP